MDFNQIYNEDCVTGMQKLPDNCIDLCITSPPYNLGVKYDVYNDWMEWDAYYDWCRLWLNEIYRVLKPDGRFCLNHYLSCGTSKTRSAPLMNLHCICNKIGFLHHGIALWDDRTLTKYQAWGSWKSASAPYINCLIPETLIFTSSGIKKVDNVYSGDETLGIDGRFEQVLSLHCRNHTGEVVKIISQSHFDPIICTPEHKFYIRIRTPTYKKKPFNRKYNLTNPEWVSAGNISPNHTGTRISERKYFIAHPIDKNAKLPTIPHGSKIPLHNAEFYWLVGFYLAEGSLRNKPVSEKRHGNYDVYLTTHIDECDMVSKHLSNLNVHFRVKKWERYCRFEISNKELYYFFKKFYDEGAIEIKGTKSHLRTIPEWVVQLPQEHLTQLIEGYFSGDGHLFKKRKTFGKMITSTSIKLLLQTQRILFKLGKYARIHRVRKAKTLTVFNKINKVVHTKEAYSLMWYDNVTRYSPVIFEDDKVWVQIKKVSKEQYAGLVYDLTIEGTHTYHTMQGVSHNSPHECILITYKDHWKKDRKGETEISPKEFMEACSGVWKIHPLNKSKSLTMANFPVELPMRCIKLLSYKGDVILDPFSGSGTTAYAAKVLGRRYIGFEISKNYWEISQKRIEQCGLDTWVDKQ